jgi:hypothetical protein
MDVLHIDLTVLFEEPFWVGIFERHDAEGYAVARWVFGSEPNGPEVYDVILNQFNALQFSAPLRDAESIIHKTNFKRAQRAAKESVNLRGISTKAQEARRLDLEKHKAERKPQSKQEREAEAQHKFELRQIKKKEKHRGH